MAAQILLKSFQCLIIILLICNVKSEDISSYLRPKRGVAISEEKCQPGNVTTDQGTLQCIEKCHLMQEARKSHHLKHLKY